MFCIAHKRLHCMWLSSAIAHTPAPRTHTLHVTVSKVVSSCTNPFRFNSRCVFVPTLQRFKFQLVNEKAVRYGVTVTLPISGGLFVTATERRSSSSSSSSTH